MDFNTFLKLFGLNPDQFEQKEAVIEEIGGRIVVPATQRQDVRRCPKCGGGDASTVKDHYTVRVRALMPNGSMGFLLIRKPKFFCRRCGSSYTMPLEGVAPRSTVSKASLDSMRRDMSKMTTFAAIAKEYGCSSAYVMQRFDGWYKEVPGRPLPRVLCIDEICFRDRIEGKYPAVVYDWEAREVVDLVRSRQKAWLEEWFAKKPEGERKRVEWFVSDMYDEYRRVKRRFFPKAVHVVDLFHVVKLLADAVKKLRTNAMNEWAADSLEYGFMKSRWNLFQMRLDRMPGKEYRCRSTGEVVSWGEGVRRCVKSTPALWDGWSILQELMGYSRYKTFAEALSFVERIAKRLSDSPSPLLNKVGASYRKWSVEIANGLVANKEGFQASNGVAEGLNNQLKTLKKISNGCLSFDRFRKRALLILTYGKNR